MAYLWKQILIPSSPATGDHYTKPIVKISSDGSIILETQLISGYNTTGPYTLTGYGDVYDNFGNKQLPQFTTTTATIPDSAALTAFSASDQYDLALPSDLKGGVAFYVSGDGTHWIINRDVIAGQNDVISQTTDVVDATIPVADSVVGLFSPTGGSGGSFPNSYGVAYVVSDNGGDANIYWQGYNAGGSLANASPVSLTGGFVAVDSTPAVDISAAGGAFVEAYENTTGVSGSHDITFKSFNPDGSFNTNIGGGTGTFTLGAAGSNVTDITDIQFKQFSSGGSFAVVDDELQTDGNYHVVFRHDASGTVVKTDFTLSTTPQRVEVAINNNDGTSVIGWGDKNGTGVTLAEFDSSGNQISIGAGGTYSFNDGNFKGLQNLGDGRVAVEFVQSSDGGVTTQDVIDIVDLRTPGQTIDIHTQSTAQEYNLAGTSGNDIITGSDTVFTRYDGAAGSDIFKFDLAKYTALQSGGQFDEIVDYNQGNTGLFSVAEGDQLDISAIVGAAYNHGSGQPIDSLVRVVTSGANADLQVDADPTAVGAHWVTIAQLDNIRSGNAVNVILDSSAPAGTPITVQNGNITSDFNGDGTTDILLQNSQQLAEWQMNGTAIQPGSGGIGTLGTGWAVARTGDFNNDGHADLLLQNGQQLAEWQMNGTAIQPGSGGIGTLGAGWAVAGTGDFNSDGNGRSPAAERPAACPVGDERDNNPARQRRHRHPGGGLGGGGHRRFQRRWHGRHSAAERPAACPVGNERDNNPARQRRHRYPGRGLDRGRHRRF